MPGQIYADVLGDGEVGGGQGVSKGYLTTGTLCFPRNSLRTLELLLCGVQHLCRSLQTFP